MGPEPSGQIPIGVRVGGWLAGVAVGAIAYVLIVSAVLPQAGIESAEFVRLFFGLVPTLVVAGWTGSRLAALEAFPPELRARLTASAFAASVAAFAAVTVWSSTAPESSDAPRSEILVSIVAPILSAFIAVGMTEAAAAITAPWSRAVRGTAVALVVIGAGTAIALAVVLARTSVDPSRTDLRLDTTYVCGAAPAGRGVWLPNCADDTVTEVDPVTLRTRRTVRLVGVPIAAAGDPGHSVWIAYSGGNGTGGVARLDSETGRLLARIPAGGDVSSVSIGGGAVWLADGEEVVKIDSRFNYPVGKLRLAGASSALMAFGSLWVATEAGVARADADTLAVITTVGHPATGLAAGARSIWAATGTGVERIDPRTDSTKAYIPGCPGSSGVAFARGFVWAVCYDNDTLVRIDPRNDRVVDSIEVGEWPTTIASDARFLWVSYGDSSDGDVVTRIDLGVAAATNG